MQSKYMYRVCVKTLVFKVLANVNEPKNKAKKLERPFTDKLVHFSFLQVYASQGLGVSQLCEICFGGTILSST